MASFLLSHRGTIDIIPDEFVHTLVVEGTGSVQNAAETARDVWRDTVWDSTGLNLRGYYNDEVSYVGVSAAEILDLSLGTLSAAFHADYENPLPGTAPGGMVPAQIACCVSLTAGTRPNGAPLKGRTYLPGPGSSAVLSGLFSEAFGQDVYDAFAAYRGALETAGLQASVWSRTMAAVQPLTAHRVGLTPDTIRSRRNALPEVYIDSTAP